MHDVSTGEPELAFQPLGRKHHLPEDRGAETGGVALDRVDDRTGGGTFLSVPIAAIREFWSKLLTEQAGDMLAWRSEAVGRRPMRQRTGAAPCSSRVSVTLSRETPTDARPRRSCSGPGEAVPAGLRRPSVVKRER